MVICYQNCGRDCPHKPKGPVSEPFDPDLMSRSFEYAASRLGPHWNFENRTLDMRIMQKVVIIRCGTMTREKLYQIIDAEDQKIDELSTRISLRALK